MKRILLIEDDTILRESTAELLELSGYEVRMASNGKKGVQITKEYLPDVIISDIMMPELDGFGVLEALSQDVQTKTIPFIFLSARTERKDVRKGMEHGADDYLTKPFEEDELIGAIESRLAKMAILRETKEENPEIKPSSTTPISDKSVKRINDLKNYIDHYGEKHDFNLGETIYREGRCSNTVYLVLKGVVKSYKLDTNGKELITGIYKMNDFFGFSCFSPNMTHKEYATAIEESKLAVISAENLKSLLKENHGLTMELIQLFSENLSEAKEQLLEMAYGSVRRKTASTILKFAEKLQRDPKENLHILRSDLASVAGMATETLIRTLSSFKKEGLILIEDRDIRILDVERLSRVE